MSDHGEVQTPDGWRLRHRIERLHRRSEHADWCDHDGMDWPCPTILAIPEPTEESSP